MSIQYPIDCDSPAKRTEYLYRAQELLRSLHNSFSKWLHEGLSEEEFNMLPGKIKSKYPYKEFNIEVEPNIFRLSQRGWDLFYKEDFMARSNKLSGEICEQRDMLKASVNYSIDIGEI